MTLGLIEYSLHCLEGLSKQEQTEQVSEMMQDHIKVIRECVETLVVKEEE